MRASEGLSSLEHAFCKSCEKGSRNLQATFL